MHRISLTALKVVLVIAGAFLIFISLDFGFGGFKTLGWQGLGSTDFIQILDQARYGLHDSHFRFLSGAFGASGVFMIFAVSNLQKYQQTLKFIFALIFVGGLMRFTSGDVAVLFGAEIGGALLVELGLTALLYVWLARAVKATG